MNESIVVVTDDILFGPELASVATGSALNVQVAKTVEALRGMPEVLLQRSVLVLVDVQSPKISAGQAVEVLKEAGFSSTLLGVCHRLIPSVVERSKNVGIAHVIARDTAADLVRRLVAASADGAQAGN